MLSIVKRILGQIKKINVQWAYCCLHHVLVLTLLYFILGDSNYVPQIAVYDMNEKFVTELEQNANVVELDRKILRRKSILEENRN